MSEDTSFEELFEEIPERPLEQEILEPKPTEEQLKPEHIAEKPKTEEKPKEPAELPKEERKEEKSTFDLSEEKEHLGETVLVYGEKGDGKTVFAFSLTGKICCVSFDRKSLQIKNNYYKNDDRIKVYDGLRYIDKSSGDAWLESASKSIDYLNELLFKEVSKHQPDWIVIDNMEVFVRTCEMAMRERNNLKAFQPFSWDYWKERNMYVDQIHNLCQKFAKKGVIYTAYINEQVQTIKDGKIVEMKRQPKWSADIKYQAETVIFVDSEKTPNGLRFFAEVESCKTSKFRTGDRRDVTNIGIQAFFEKKPTAPTSVLAPKPEPTKPIEIPQEKEIIQEEELF